MNAILKTFFYRVDTIDKFYFVNFFFFFCKSYAILIDRLTSMNGKVQFLSCARRRQRSSPSAANLLLQRVTTQTALEKYVRARENTFDLVHRKCIQRYTLRRTVSVNCFRRSVSGEKQSLQRSPLVRVIQKPISLWLGPRPDQRERAPVFTLYRVAFS